MPQTDAAWRRLQDIGEHTHAGAERCGECLSKGRIDMGGRAEGRTVCALDTKENRGLGPCLGHGGKFLHMLGASNRDRIGEEGRPLFRQSDVFGLHPDAPCRAVQDKVQPALAVADFCAQLRKTGEFRDGVFVHGLA